MEFLKAIQEAGVVGAGGAGFPTHVKLAGKARTLIINAAECEPLIETDKYLCRTEAATIVTAIGAVSDQIGAERRVIALKGKYYTEIETLRQAIAKAGAQIELFEMGAYYPAGDEQIMVQQILGLSVPERGIPLDVGAVVNNVGTLVNIADALHGQPVIDKHLSVAGEVDKPLMFKVPIGTPVTEVLNQAGLRIADYALILGGPMMGLMMVDPQKIASTVVTKTLGSLIVLPAGHTMVQTWRMRQNVGRLRHQTKSACIQCRMCTDLCPRYLIGHQMRPHLVMRNFWREDAISDPDEYIRAFGDAVNCCDCGICEEFACPMGLSPRKVNDHFKQMIRQKGLTVPRNLHPTARPGLNEGRTPTLRLVARLGLTAYSGRHATECREFTPDSVFIPFRQHIGKPAVPIRQVGEHVRRGELLAQADPDGLSANIHCSLDGILTEISATGARISRKEV